MLTHIFLLFEDPHTPDLRVYVSNKRNMLELFIVMAGHDTSEIMSGRGLNVSTKLRELSLSWETAMLNAFTGLTAVKTFHRYIHRH